MGPLRKQSTEADVKRFFGAANVLHQELRVPDSEGWPGLVVYFTPSYKPSNQSLAIFPCDGHICRISVSSARWKTPQGIRIGTTLQELEAVNGRPFRFYGFGWDFQGSVLSWEGGRLENEFGRDIQIGVYANGRTKLTAAENKHISGDQELLSSDPIVRKVGLRVSELTALFEP